MDEDQRGEGRTPAAALKALAESLLAEAEAEWWSRPLPEGIG